MTKRMILAITLAFACVFGLAIPANAGAAWFRYESHPKSWNIPGVLFDQTLTIQTLWGYGSPADGDGVELRYMEFDVTSGCGTLEASGGKIVDITISSYRTPGIYDIPLHTVHLADVNTCSPVSRNFSLMGPDTGPAGLRMTAHVRVNSPLTHDKYPVWEICASHTC